jgi:ankyrin repeat protein
VRAALAAQHEAIACLLIELDSAERYGTASKQELRENCTEIVQLLVEHGNQIDAGGWRGSALLAASVAGNAAVVELLIEHGDADNSVKGPQRSALGKVPATGQAGIVERLINHRESMILDGGLKGNAVEATSMAGFIRLIHEHTARGRASALALGLVAASEVGHGLIVQLLLDHGAQDKDSALEAASAAGHETIVQLLLDHGGRHGALAGTLATECEVILDLPCPPTSEEVATLRRMGSEIPIGAWLVAIIGAFGTSAYHGITASLQNYIQNDRDDPLRRGALGLGQSSATRLSYFLTFFVYATAFGGAVVADGWLGRYKSLTLFAGCVHYILVCDEYR